MAEASDQPIEVSKSGDDAETKISETSVDVKDMAAQDNRNSSELPSKRSEDEEVNNTSITSPEVTPGIIGTEQVGGDEFVQVVNEASVEQAESNSTNDSHDDLVQFIKEASVDQVVCSTSNDPPALVDGYTHILSSVAVSDVHEGSEQSESVASQLKQLNSRMNDYEKEIWRQNEEISQLKEKIKEKDGELERYQSQSRNQDPSYIKNRLKEKDKEFQTMKLEFNRNRSLVGDLQMSVKQIHNQIKSMANNSLEFEDRLSDLEKLSPKMGVFEWRLENYSYHSQNAEYLSSPEFYTHLNGYCCYLSVQWFGNKNGRLGLYLHLDKKKNMHLVENCKINVLIQCAGSFGLSKDHEVHYDADDVDSDSSVYELDESIISGDHYFLLKPFLDKYLIDDCLYFYISLLPDPSTIA